MGALALTILATSCGGGTDDSPQPERQPMEPPQETYAPELQVNLDAMTRSESGLYFEDLTVGEGDLASPGSRVEVHYTGWTTDGNLFDSSVVRGEPTSFPLNRVIPGWTEGVQMMVAGEKRRFWIPENLAYQGRPGAPPGMLVFDVELLFLYPWAVASRPRRPACQKPSCPFSLVASWRSMNSIAPASVAPGKSSGGTIWSQAMPALVAECGSQVVFG